MADDISNEVRSSSARGGGVARGCAGLAVLQAPRVRLVRISHRWQGYGVWKESGHSAAALLSKTAVAGDKQMECFSRIFELLHRSRETN